MALRTVRNWLEQHHDKVDRIIFINFLDAEQRVYLQALPKFFPPAYDPEFFAQYSASAEQWAKETREPISDTESEEEEEVAESDDNDEEDPVHEVPVVATAPPVGEPLPVAPAEEIPAPAADQPAPPA